MWHDAKGYEGRLQVTRCGKIRSVDRYVNNYPKGKRLLRGREIKGSIGRNGYIVIALTSKTKDGVKGRNEYLHRIICNTFTFNKLNLETVNHIDGNKLNNACDNLEWMSFSDNVQHAKDIGLCDNIKKPVLATDGVNIFEFESLQSTKLKGFNPSLVHAAINGRQRTHKKLTWKYK